MKSQFIISTTNNIEGCPIIEYIDTLHSNFVIGTNIFSDISATLSDIFGGYSETYKRKLGEIYDKATKELKKEAIRLGANAIVGFKVDFDEISGGNKSMFMISVCGTACIIDRTNYKLKDEIKSSSLSLYELNKEYERRYIISRVNAGYKLENYWVDFLVENPQVEIIESLVERYKNLDAQIHTNSMYNIERVISATPLSDTVPIVYKNCRNINIVRLIKQCNLFSPSSIYEIIKEDLHLGVYLLSSQKKFYEREDLEHIENILGYIDALPNTGKIETVKGGIFSKSEVNKYICIKGHSNPEDKRFCGTCGIDIKGFNQEEVDIIEKFRIEYDIIKKYFSQE